MIKLYSLALLLLLSVHVQAAPDERQYIQRLNKISNFIRGSGRLSESEVLGLKEAYLKGEAESYIKEQTERYLLSEAHVMHMSTRMEQMFGLRPTTPYIYGKSTPETNSEYSKVSGYEYYNSLNALFRTMARENQSWDTLLVGKSYLAYPNDMTKGSQFMDDDRISDEMFYNQVRSEAQISEGIVENDRASFQMMSAHEPQTFTPMAKKYVFSEDNPKIAGAITTSRFFERYPNSSLNHNRKRAAALFRIFLCDAMVPFAGATNQMKSLNDFLPELVSTDTDLPHGTEEELHGNRPDCQNCHYKLDPMGRTMLPITRTLSRMNSKGHLTYRNEAGQLIDVVGHGIGEIAQGITQQKEYVSCQVNNFISWFFGPLVVLGEKRYNEIMVEFNKRGRRMNDFIAYLVEQPEFVDPSYKPDPNIVVANQVKKIFRTCSNCHGTDTPSATGTAPDLVDYFFHRTGFSKKGMLGYVKDMINLEGDCTGGEMPPKDANWKLSPTECQSIKDWVRAGAPDLNGLKQVEVKP
jgi:hypothetical protein